jgi:hypothetical protein
MSDDHALRSECAQHFGKLSAEITALRGEDGVSRDEFRILRDVISANHQGVMNSITMVREDVSALKVKSSVWGALGGALTAFIAILLSILSGAFGR